MMIIIKRIVETRDITRRTTGIPIQRGSPAKRPFSIASENWLEQRFLIVAAGNPLGKSLHTHTQIHLHQVPTLAHTFSRPRSFHFWQIPIDRRLLLGHHLLGHRYKNLSTACNSYNVQCRIWDIWRLGPIKRKCPFTRKTKYKNCSRHCGVCIMFIVKREHCTYVGTYLYYYNGINKKSLKDLNA